MSSIGLRWNDLDEFRKVYPDAQREIDAVKIGYGHRSDFSAINVAKQCFYSKLFLFCHVDLNCKKELVQWLGPGVELVQLSNKSKKSWRLVAIEKISELTDGFKAEHGIIPGEYLPKDAITHQNAWLYSFNNGRICDEKPCNKQNVTVNSSLKPHGFEQFIASCPHSVAPIMQAAQAAKYNYPIIITGERGTGRCLLAESINRVSQSSLTKINFLMASENDFEEYLLGNDGKNGILSTLNGGTLFLEDVDRYSPTAQLLLLKVLSASRGIRIIASATHNLQAMVNEDRFIPELFDLLAGISLETIPLRERRGDITLIAHHFIQQLNAERDTLKSLSPKTIKALQDYSWAGNIDELKRVLTQAHVFSTSNIIERNDLPFATVRKKSVCGHTGEPLAPGFNLNHLIEDIQKDYIKQALHNASGKKAIAAGLLGLKSYQALDAKMKALKISAS